MSIKLEKFNKAQMRTDIPEIRPGDTVKVFQKIIGEKNQEKIQIFEGLIIAKKHGKGVPATITVRKIITGIGVEKIFFIHSPIIEKIEIVKRGKVRRAKLYYIREAKGRKAKLKKKEFTQEVAGVTPEEDEPTKEQEPDSIPTIKQEISPEIEEIKE